MKLTITHQPSYSRLELILRTLFGWIYIALPHSFLLFFVGIWGSILGFVSWWIILFTGQYPQSMFEFQVGLLRWQTRLNARIFNLCDGYPSFGVNGTDEGFTDLQIKYPEKLSRGHLILKTLFGGFYVGFPHGFVLMFRYLWLGILQFLAFWAILFVGRFPASWHSFSVGTIRWGIRLNMYFGLWMSDEYPPFTGKELDYETKEFETSAETV